MTADAALEHEVVGIEKAGQCERRASGLGQRPSAKIRVVGPRWWAGFSCNDPNRKWHHPAEDNCLSPREGGDLPDLAPT